MSIASRMAAFEQRSTSSLASAAAPPDGPQDLWAAIDAAADGAATSFDLKLGPAQQQFVALSDARKQEALSRLANAPPALTTICLDSLTLDDSHVPLLADILRRPTLMRISLERNILCEPGLLSLADVLLSLDGSGSLV